MTLCTVIVATLAESRKKDPVMGVRSLGKHTYIA